MVKLKICSSCHKERVIWKNVVEGGERKMFCKNCWCTHHITVKKTKKTGHSPLSRQSKKRIIQLSEYSKLIKDFKEKHNVCQAGIPNHCIHKPTDIHHTNGRVNEKLNDTTDWLHICRGCHDWIHTHPKEARLLNLLK